MIRWIPVLNWDYEGFSYPGAHEPSLDHALPSFATAEEAVEYARREIDCSGVEPAAWSVELPELGGLPVGADTLQTFVSGVDHLTFKDSVIDGSANSAINIDGQSRLG